MVAVENFRGLPSVVDAKIFEQLCESIFDSLDLFLIYYLEITSSFHSSVIIHTNKISQFLLIQSPYYNEHLILNQCNHSSAVILPECRCKCVSVNDVEMERSAGDISAQNFLIYSNSITFLFTLKSLSGFANFSQNKNFSSLKWNEMNYLGFTKAIFLAISKSYNIV